MFSLNGRAFKGFKIGPFFIGHHATLEKCLHDLIVERDMTERRLRNFEKEPMKKLQRLLIEQGKLIADQATHKDFEAWPIVEYKD